MINRYKASAMRSSNTYEKKSIRGKNPCVVNSSGVPDQTRIGMAPWYALPTQFGTNPFSPNHASKSIRIMHRLMKISDDITSRNSPIVVGDLRPNQYSSRLFSHDGNRDN